MEDLPVTKAVVIPASELSWTAVASGGPGGQHVNKVATKVQLRWTVGTSAVLPGWARERLAAQNGNRIDSKGNLLISCGETRSQDRNLEVARERLAGLVRAALDRPKRRRPTRPSRAAKARRMDAKRRLSQKKQNRRPDHD